jgi:hypothetical protein
MPMALMPKKKRFKKMSKQERYRVMHKFWLDLKKNDEDWLDERIHELKKKRTFVKVVRDALRLFLDLKQGKVEVLVELFPWVKAEFMAGVKPQKTVGDLELQLERLEKLLTEQRAVQHDAPRSLQPMAVDGSKSLNAPKFDLLSFDDDDELDTLVLTKDTGSNAQNLLNSMLAFR